MIDRAALGHRRRRATAADAFLQQAAVQAVQDRLEMVNKSFTRVAVVTPFAGIWHAVLPDATLVADDDVLPLAVGGHDLVIHALSLHWANDPVGQLVQCRRALRPDGLCLAMVLGGETLTELRSVLAQAESDVSGGLSPRVAPMAEIRDLGSLLQRAGFALPVADSERLVAEYTDLFHLMRDLRHMGEANALNDRLRIPTKRAVFDRAAQLYQQHFPGQDGRVRATFELIALTGWAPSADQPQPLRPGSAQARLAEALGTDERPLGD